MKTANYMTVDFEEWYQGLTSTSSLYSRWDEFESRIEIGAEWLLESFEKAGVKATFFIVGKVAEDNPSMIKKIAGAGHEIGLHGAAHKKVLYMSRKEFAADLAENIFMVERAAGVTPVSFRAPCFSVNASTPWLWEELAAKGIMLDSSVFPIRVPLYGYPGGGKDPFETDTPNGAVREIPMSVINIAGINLPFSGGFYFRMLPYPLVRGAINRINREGKPVVFYCHPWEFDPGHPMPDTVTIRERVSHYGWLKNARRKFTRLLDDFSFVPLGTAMELAP